MPTRGQLRRRVYEEFKTILDPTNELVGVAQDMMESMNKKGAVSLDSTPIEKTTAVLFTEAYSRFLAVKLLCEDGMGTMSLIVLRSLLNLFFMFYWILTDSIGSRIRRYIGWGWKRLKENIDESPSDYSTELKRQARDEYEFAKKKNLYTFRIRDKRTGRYRRKRAKYWHEPKTIIQMAGEIGLVDHYDDAYRPLSWVEHIDPYYVMSRAIGGKIKLDPGFDDTVLYKALAGNFTYFRQICEKVNDVFSLGKGKVLKDFAKQQKNFKKPAKV